MLADLKAAWVRRGRTQLESALTSDVLWQTKRWWWDGFALDDKFSSRTEALQPLRPASNTTQFLLSSGAYSFEMRHGGYMQFAVATKRYRVTTVRVHQRNKTIRLCANTSKTVKLVIRKRVASKQELVTINCSTSASAEDQTGILRNRRSQLCNKNETMAAGTDTIPAGGAIFPGSASLCSTLPLPGYYIQNPTGRPQSLLTVH